MTLAGKVLLIVPALDVPITELGLLKFVWLKALNSSNRNVSFIRSLIANSR
jgi:hypothetical protein